MASSKFLLFDFDGVIADTFHIAHGIAKRMCVYLTESEYRKQFEGNIYKSTDTFLAASADHGDRCDHALDWWAAYGPEFKVHARAFVGMPELVKEFSSIYTICIVSSSHDDLINEFLERYDLRNAVTGVYGVEASVHKDEKFRSIFAKYAISPKDCLLVTDTLGDINEATLVGLSSIGVTWGFQDKETLLRGNPIEVVELPSELPNAVENYFRSA